MSRRPDGQDVNDSRNARGVVLLITLVILIVLSVLGYTLSAQVAARRHRDRYIIDYAQAQYACTSGIKQAVASLGSLEPELISRPNEPDFSDVFAMSEPVYQDFLAQAAAEMTAADDRLTDGGGRRGTLSEEDLDGTSADWGDDANGVGWQPPVVIAGPYGPAWPLATEAVEFEIASAKVTVEIEDENAKYPLGWALIQDEKLQAQADVGFVSFCEWMGYQKEEIGTLKEDLVAIGQIRPFKVVFETTTVPTATTAAANLRSRVSRSRSTRTATARRSTARRAVPVAEQIQQQNAIFSRFFHSSLLDADLLSRPSVASDSRKESAMKYLGLWATRKVNINTAPRQVLEAALTFGSIADAPKIAEVIIEQRKQKPFSDIEELKKVAFRYADAVDKCKDFITTSSTMFSVRVTAVSGVAKVVAIAGVSKDGPKIKRIGVISD